MRLSEGVCLGLHHILFSLLIPCSAVVAAAVGNTHKQILLVGNNYESYHSATMEVVHHFRKRTNNNLLFKYGTTEIVLERGILIGISQQHWDFPMSATKQEGEKTPVHLGFEKNINFLLVNSQARD